MPKSIPQISEQAKILVSFLQPRTSACWDELEKYLGESVRFGRGRGWLETAKRVLQRDYNQVWVCVRKVGIRLADASETIDSASCEVEKVHRASKRGINRLATLDFSKLDNALRLQLNAKASHLSAIHGITSHKSCHLITSAVASQNERLPLAKTLAAFGGLGNGSKTE
jgi:hypothetical protein